MFPLDRRFYPACFDAPNHVHDHWDAILHHIFHSLNVNVEQHVLSIPRYDRVEHPALAHVHGSCPDRITHLLRDLGVYLPIDRSACIFTLRAHFSLPDSAQPFTHIIALRLDVKPLHLFSEQLLVIEQLFPSLQHLFLHFPCGKRESRAAEHYELALRTLRQFLQTAAAGSLRSLAYSWTSCTQLVSTGRILSRILAWDPLPLPNSLVALDFQPRLGLHVDAQRRGISPLLLLPSRSGLRSLTVAATDFALINPTSWIDQSQLTRIVIIALPPRDDIIAPVPAATLARCLAYASPCWQRSVCVLQLHGIAFDLDCALAIADLAALTHFDLCPRALFAENAHLLLDVENDNLCTAQSTLEAFDDSLTLGTSEKPCLVYLDCASTSHVKALPCALAADRADDLLVLLKICLPSLLRLRVLHLGITARSAPHPVVYPHGLAAVLHVIAPSLVIIGLGPEPRAPTRPVHIHSARSCECNDRLGYLQPYLDPACAASLADECLPTIRADFN